MKKVRGKTQVSKENKLASKVHLNPSQTIISLFHSHNSIFPPLSQRWSPFPSKLRRFFKHGIFGHGTQHDNHLKLGVDRPDLTTLHKMLLLGIPNNIG